jgi:hypothetical protein
MVFIIYFLQYTPFVWHKNNIITISNDIYATCNSSYVTLFQFSISQCPDPILQTESTINRPHFYAWKQKNGKNLYDQAETSQTDDTLHKASICPLKSAVGCKVYLL